MFEDVIMISLNIAIFSRIIHVPFLESGLSWWPIVAQFSTTILSILSTCLNLYFESKGLKENFVEYVMTSVKAKQDWVPFGYMVRESTIKSDLDFSRIEFKIPYLTDASGSYLALEY